MLKPKPLKAPKNAHTSNSKNGMGDHYGTGVRNPYGKIRDFGEAKFMPKSKTKNAPRSLA